MPQPFVFMDVGAYNPTWKKTDTTSFQRTPELQPAAAKACDLRDIRHTETSREAGDDLGDDSTRT